MISKILSIITLQSNCPYNRTQSKIRRKENVLKQQFGPNVINLEGKQQRAARRPGALFLSCSYHSITMKRRRDHEEDEEFPELLLVI